MTTAAPKSGTWTVLHLFRSARLNARWSSDAMAAAESAISNSALTLASPAADVPPGGFRVLNQHLDARGECLGISRPHDHTRLAINHKLRDAREGRCDHRYSERHGLDQAIRESLPCHRPEPPRSAAPGCRSPPPSDALRPRPGRRGR